MPSQNPLGYLPPEVQLQLLGGSAPAGMGLFAALLAGSGQQTLPAVTSPEYAKLVRAGKIQPPKIGTMEYLDFAARNPGLVGNMNQPKGKASGGQNLIDVLTGNSALSRPGY